MSGEWGINDMRARIAALEAVGPVVVAWGGITGTLSAQADLNGALAAKQPLATVLTNTTASFTTAQESKLTGIAAGATANAADAFLLSRGNHTGTQAITTVTGLQTALDGKQVAGSYAAAAHGHVIADVTGLQSALDGKESAGVAASADAAHVAALDPHPQYLTQAEGDAAYLPGSARGASNGVAPLIGGLVPLLNLPSLSGDPWTYVKLASTATTTGTANIDTALAFAPPALSTVIFEGQLFLQAAATTTGVRPGLKWPTLGVLKNIARVESPSSATASALRFWGNTATANAAATGVSVANEGLFGQIQGTIVTGPVVTGNLIVTLASEVAASEVRIMANSWLRWRTI